MDTNQKNMILCEMRDAVGVLDHKLYKCSVGFMASFGLNILGFATPFLPIAAPKLILAAGLCAAISCGALGMVVSLGSRHKIEDRFKTNWRQKMAPIWGEACRTGNVGWMREVISLTRYAEKQNEISILNEEFVSAGLKEAVIEKKDQAVHTILVSFKDSPILDDILADPELPELLSPLIGHGQPKDRVEVAGRYIVHGILQSAYDTNNLKALKHLLGYADGLIENQIKSIGFSSFQSLLHRSKQAIYRDGQPETVVFPPAKHNL